ncbi:MAG: lpxD, partial [Variovorax sp.]|nr:lpxD [Variovorax sp.]
MALRLEDIVGALGGELHGDPAVSIERLAPLATAPGDALSFLSHPKYAKELAASRAACVIVAPAMAQAAAARGAFIATPDPYL